MDRAEFVVRGLPALGPGAKRIQLECSHGRTFGLLVPGRKPITDQVVLDLLRVRHDRDNKCHCTTVLRPGTATFDAGGDATLIPPGESPRPSAIALERYDT